MAMGMTGIGIARDLKGGETAEVNTKRGEHSASRTRRMCESVWNTYPNQ
jgi:hypothetical protein